MLAKALCIFCLLSLFYQDIRYRAVYWISFPILLGLLLWMLYGKIAQQNFLSNTIYNLLFLTLQMALVSAYFSLKNKQWINITSMHIGWGDLLFLICIAFYLSPVNYLLFYISSLMLVLLLFGIQKGNKKIPLAGLQALLFALLLIADWNIPAIDLIADTWLLNYLIA